MGAGFLCLRLQNDGANRIEKFSGDGTNFVTWRSVSLADFLSPNQIGLGIDPEGPLGNVMNVLSWTVTTP
jgi:hypothetical protein